MSICKDTFSRIVYTTILGHEHKGTQWRGGGSYVEDHHQKVQLLERVQGNSTRPVHNHVPSTYFIAIQCNTIVILASHVTIAKARL